MKAPPSLPVAFSQQTTLLVGFNAGPATREMYLAARKAGLSPD